MYDIVMPVSYIHHLGLKIREIITTRGVRGFAQKLTLDHVVPKRSLDNRSIAILNLTFLLICLHNMTRRLFHNIHRGTYKRKTNRNLIYECIPCA